MKKPKLEGDLRDQVLDRVLDRALESMFPFLTRTNAAELADDVITHLQTHLCSKLTAIAQPGKLAEIEFSSLKVIELHAKYQADVRS